MLDGRNVVVWYYGSKLCYGYRGWSQSTFLWCAVFYLRLWSVLFSLWSISILFSPIWVVFMLVWLVSIIWLSIYLGAGSFHFGFHVFHSCFLSTVLALVSNSARLLNREERFVSEGRQGEKRWNLKRDEWDLDSFTVGWSVSLVLVVYGHGGMRGNLVLYHQMNGLVIWLD